MKKFNKILKWRKTHADRESFNVVFDDDSVLTLSKRSDEERKKSNLKDTWFYLGFVGEIGFTIALPIIGGACIGMYLDRAWSSYPKVTLLLLFLGIVISFIAFIATIRELLTRKNS
jgi:ATP synthase protein I